MKEDKTGYSLFDKTPQFSDASTGSYNGSSPHKLVDQKFDRYVVTIRLNDNDQFMGIEKIEINQDFMSFDQKLSNIQFIDSEKLYEE